MQPDRLSKLLNTIEGNVDLWDVRDEWAELKQELTSQSRRIEILLGKYALRQLHHDDVGSTINALRELYDGAIHKEKLNANRD